ncbi:MAG: hypothetical protein AAGE52_01275 [Myxococcota bacterium]
MTPRTIRRRDQLAERKAAKRAQKRLDHSLGLMRSAHKRASKRGEDFTPIRASITHLLQLAAIPGVEMTPADREYLTSLQPDAAP